MKYIIAWIRSISNAVIQILHHPIKEDDISDKWEREQTLGDKI